MSIFEYILLNYRWLFICFYFLPVSMLSDIYLSLKKWLTFKIYSSPKHHDKKIKNIQRQIHQWIKSGQKVKICTTPCDFQNILLGRPTCENSFYSVKVNLLDILEVNNEKKTVKVEPLVTVRQLLSSLLPLGWTIPVVPGNVDSAIGSFILGAGFDSSSHKYGFFHNTCLSYELVMTDGSLVHCSKELNSDLFFVLPWSHGTLGLLTAVEIQLIPAPNFVRLQLKAYHNEELAVKKFAEECTSDSNDFVEGLLYNDNQCLVITGQLVNQTNIRRINEIGKWYKSWFFQYVKKYFITGYGVEFIPLKDYYHRHSRSSYWGLQEIIPFANNIFFRMFFGWAVPPKLNFFELNQTELVKKLYKTQPINLDVIVPKDKLQVLIDTFDKKVKVYPVWLCPVKVFSTPGFVHSHTSNDEIFINLGIYGVPKAISYCPDNSIKEIEEVVKNVKGFKMSHGDIHMNETEFRQQFDHSLYDLIRQKWNCQKAFPTVYEKITEMNSNI